MVWILPINLRVPKSCSVLLNIIATLNVHVGLLVSPSLLLQAIVNEIRRRMALAALMAVLFL